MVCVGVCVCEWVSAFLTTHVSWLSFHSLFFFFFVALFICAVDCLRTCWLPLAADCYTLPLSIIMFSDQWTKKKKSTPQNLFYITISAPDSQIHKHKCRVLAAADNFFFLFAFFFLGIFVGFFSFCLSQIWFGNHYAFNSLLNANYLFCSYAYDVLSDLFGWAGAPVTAAERQ